jgi:hypothetical protein
MNLFEDDKAAKLKRILPLRIMNMLGMIAWREDSYHCANQKLRLLHPLVWLYLIVMLPLFVILHGVVEVSKEIKSLFRDETVWW